MIGTGVTGLRKEAEVLEKRSGQGVAVKWRERFVEFLDFLLVGLARCLDLLLNGRKLSEAGVLGGLFLGNRLRELVFTAGNKVELFLDFRMIRGGRNAENKSAEFVELTKKLGQV